MPSPVKAIPEGYHSLTPYLIVSDAAGALAWYTEVFGAQELFRFPMEDGRIGHAEMQLGTSKFMLADEFPDMGARGPITLGGSPVGLLLYVDKVDAVFEAALRSGATPIHPVENKFYGDRSGTVADPFGHQWTLSTHIEDLTPEEMKVREKAASTAS